jgi:steroid 5-alpha reductase family enzyme
MSEILRLLSVNAALATACFILLWLVSLRLKDPSFIDAWWPLGMVMMAWSSLALLGVRTAHALALAILCSVWGLRLGIYLFARWRRQGPDPRYAKMLAEATAQRGWGYGVASLLLVFAPQAPLQVIVCLPVQLGTVTQAAVLGPLAWAGIALAVFGIGFESLGDWQLARFKAHPANHGQVMDRGLWRYTRHPNYFGEACLWWGLYLIAAETGLGAWSLPGPVIVTLLLTKGSGVPTVEGRMRGQRRGYEDYVRRTSGFIPLPPKPRIA